MKNSEVTALILRPISDVEAHQLLEQSDIKILTTNEDSHEKLRDHSNCHLLDDRIDQQEIHNFVQAKIDGISEGDESYASKLSEGDLPIWYYHRFRLFHSSCELLHQIRLINAHALGTTIVYGNPILKDFYSASPHISFAQQPTSGKSGLGYRGFFNLFKLGWALFVRSFKGVSHHRSIKKSKHLIVTFPEHFKEDEKGNMRNQYLHDLLQIDDTGEFAILNLFRIPKKAELSKKITFNKELNGISYPTLSSDFIQVKYGFLSFSTIRKARSFKKRYRQKVASLLTNEGDPFIRLLLQQVLNLNSSSTLYYFQYLTYTNFLRKTQLKTITSISEQSPEVHYILDAAKSMGIHTVGIQHGVLLNNRSYNFSADDVRFRPFPEYTIVWGEKFRQELVSLYHYPEHSVKVLGQLRTDTIIGNKKDNEHRSLQRDEQKKLIVFASQPIPDESYRRKVAIDLVYACNKLKNTQLIIKIHPAENIEYYQKIVQENSVHPIEVIKDSIDLYELLDECAALVTCYSTVGIEAVYFNKPVITIDYNRMDLIHLAKSGVAKAAHSDDELHQALLSIENDTFQRNMSDHDQFVRDHAYKIDGQTTERYYDFIRSLAND